VISPEPSLLNSTDLMGVQRDSAWHRESVPIDADNFPLVAGISPS